METIHNKVKTVADAIRSQESGHLVESQQRVQQSARDSRLLPRQMIVDVWDTMGKIYGHQWESAFGTDPDPGNIWAACLCGLVESDLQKGFAAVRDLGLNYPPSAPKFRNLCLGRSIAENGESSDWEHSRIKRANEERERLQEQQPLLALENKTQKELWREKQKARMQQVKRETGLW